MVERIFSALRTKVGKLAFESSNFDIEVNAH